MASQAFPHGSCSSSQDTLRDRSRSPSSPDLHPTSAVSLADLHSVAMDIKNTLSAAISDICSDIQAIVLRVEKVKETQARHDASLCHVQQVTESHAIHLREINRHMEDLDNRGRSCNLRVRAIPETVEAAQITRAVSAIFNDLLERPPDVPIAMEYIHRALRPRGKDTDLPRDIVCCLNDFLLKEELLSKARSRGHLTSQGTEIKLFQDLILLCRVGEK